MSSAAAIPDLSKFKIQKPMSLQNKFEAWLKKKVQLQ
jgi:hypothetical protein